MRRRDSRCAAASRCGMAWHSTASSEAPAMVAASGCAPPMPPRPAVRIQRPVRDAAVMPAAHLDEGLVSALHDALAADIDPGAGRHLAVHHQALAIELVEMLPGRPVRHQIGIGDQHARRIRMGAEDADRLARLHEQRLVRLQPPQRRDDPVEGVPIARGAADAAVDHELPRMLGDLGVEIVHQHAQRRFGEPALGADLRPARGSHHAHVVETGRVHEASPTKVSRACRMFLRVARVGAARRGSSGVGQLSGPTICGSSI